MARTPLGRKLRKAFAAARMKLEKLKNNGQVGKHDMKIPKRAPVYSITENKYPSKWKGDKKNNPKVVIVGAGLAGLTCAYRLKQAGISAVIYEATSRVGGRCWTKRGFFKEGQIVERGGELIDSGHTEIQALAAELGLILDDLIEAESLGTEPFYYFDGSPYTFEEATNDFLQSIRGCKRILKKQAIRHFIIVLQNAALHLIIHLLPIISMKLFPAVSVQDLVNY